MNLIGFLVIAKNEPDDFFAAVEVEGDIAAVIEGGLKGLLAGGWIGAREGSVLDGTGFVRRKGMLFVGLGHGEGSGGFVRFRR